MSSKAGCVGCSTADIVNEICVVNVKRSGGERVYASYPPFTNYEVASKFQKLIQKSVRDPELRVCLERVRVYSSLDDLPDEFFDVLSSGEVSCEM